MKGIIKIKQLKSVISNLKQQRKKVVLVGGCFDILHPGHVSFLERAKKLGDVLVVLLESDEKVAKLKGPNRPVIKQQMRAKVLSAIKYVDLVVLLPAMYANNEYDVLVNMIKPEIIAATSKVDNLSHFKRAARLSGAKLKMISKLAGDHSTSSIFSKVTVE